MKDNTDGYNKNSGISEVLYLNDFIGNDTKEQLKKFEIFFRDSLSSDSDLLNRILKYIFDQQSKRMRPVCVFLSAAATLKPITEFTYVAAAVVEMLHTASIVHDDVIDRSEQRRGNKSINAEWSSKIAVLTGDYLLSNMLVLTAKHKMFDIIDAMANLTCEMSLGEMIQTEKSVDMDTSEEVYYEIIKKKTAILIGASMKFGAKSTGADELAQLMYETGENIGMAFQIKDDIADFEKTNLLGKPAGNDIVERKITLPLIYALKQCGEKDRKHILKCVKEADTNRKNVQTVRNFVIENRGIEYAAKVAQNYISKAVSLISTLEDSAAKQSLIKLSYYAINRTK
ncbi:MAG: polyprenyl synthetase family protein [Prevotellaceae bacterium]|jgi:octaprenyl-diphosphate synthase|nr:polyprenyl synthetase family protein [Prevotellaceae bacterium]